MIFLIANPHRNHVQYQLFFIHQPVKNESGHYGTELFAQRAVQVIQTHNQSKPLYLYLAQQAVHSANGREPLQAPDKLVKVGSRVQATLARETINNYVVPK